MNDRLQNYTVLETEDDFMIEDNGELIIGQDQDCLLGCFDEPQALTGDLDDFSVWNSALSLQGQFSCYSKALPTYAILSAVLITLLKGQCRKLH